jgi:hypothetical protein
MRLLKLSAIVGISVERPYNQSFLNLFPINIPAAYNITFAKLTQVLI